VRLGDVVGDPLLFALVEILVDVTVEVEGALRKSDTV